MGHQFGMLISSTEIQVLAISTQNLQIFYLASCVTERNLLSLMKGPINPSKAIQILNVQCSTEYYHSKTPRFEKYWLLGQSFL